MDNTIFTDIISSRTQLAAKQVRATLELLADGATIPFIARYRKERTGGLDEVQIGSIAELSEKLTETAHRKETILKTIDEQGRLMPELQTRIEACWDATELEDIYLPYKPRRRTRAQIAREQGLEPLALLLLEQRYPDPAAAAKAYAGSEAVPTVAEALSGAQDIIAEMVSEDERSRQSIRGMFRRTAVVSSKLVRSKTKDEQAAADFEARAAKYSDYFDWSEPLRRASSHRLLAMRRGEVEGILRVSIDIDAAEAVERLQHQWVHSRGECGRLVAEAVADGYKRLLAPSIETEFAASSKERADDEAIRVFAENLRQLLLGAPLGQRRVMGIDPGFRTGCKVVCLDAQGNLLHHEAIFPHPPAARRADAMERLLDMAHRYAIEAIAIGNGTASRETKDFVEFTLHQLGGEQVAKDIKLYVVSEDGASVYSASKVAREEFPDEDVTVRGAVSIARRLMDPLAELVKIDPKSIGVGQYQHDVDQTKLRRALDQTVESCVNMVGVDVNTASSHLLTYISGLGPTLARNIVDYRREHGPFTSRAELKKVPRLGPSAFEQCAGFLRITDAKNPLDGSAVHPERYALVEQMAADQGCHVADLINDKGLRARVNINNYVGADVGLPTLTDIMSELEKPGRDPRGDAETFEFAADVSTIDDLRPGMTLPGIITNITNFGAFVDIGVHQDGLVHISQLADRYVAHPTDVVRLHQHVMVRVTEVDQRRNRISLSMKNVK